MKHNRKFFFGNILAWVDDFISISTLMFFRSQLQFMKYNSKKKSDSLNWKIKSCALSLVVILVLDKRYRHLNVSSRLQTFPQKSSWLLKKFFHKSLLDYYREEKSQINFQVLYYWIVHYDFLPVSTKITFPSH